ncbi:FHA domain-containing protein [Bifidobacterium cebidarum]|uniref:FHA domain-containing protein n=1 Tax=Bifidobacterium cebidarum TaxID=2650773 RepID=A0A6I1GEM5_9BIFI|nr:FHA domain-containing protein [Bifidobacterium cebidarum]KAB7787355.1 fHA domain-containing protein [Bifidobacterium cebidarum]
MSVVPYPPAPDPGWYADDSQADNAKQSEVFAQETASLEHASSGFPEFLSFPGYDSSLSSESSSASDDDQDWQDATVQDWDSTVLSSSFIAKAPRTIYRLHNDVTGQDIVIDASTLLGRKPSMDVPEGAKAARIDDPTRTTSRNHAAISIDANGILWIEDYGSLNGTYMLHDGQETQVHKGTPVKVTVPATIRLGDLFFELTRMQ